MRTVPLGTSETQVPNVVLGLMPEPNGLVPRIGLLALGIGVLALAVSFGIVADFADQAAYELYRDHPVLRAVIEERILPVLAGRTAMQIVDA